MSKYVLGNNAADAADAADAATLLGFVPSSHYQSVALK